MAYIEFGEIFIAIRLDFRALLPLSGVLGLVGKIDGGAGKDAVNVPKPGPSRDLTVEGSNSDSGGFSKLTGEGGLF